MIKKLGTAACIAAALFTIQAPASFAATSQQQTQPKVTIISAFDNDLPIGRQYNTPNSGSTKDATGAASPQAMAAAAFTCLDDVTNPTYSGRAISGYASQDCSGSGWAPQSITVTIQKYKGLGIWNNLNKESSPVSYNASLSKGLAVSCRGLGEQTYRIVGNFYVRGGAQEKVAQSATYLRVNCDS